MIGKFIKTKFGGINYFSYICTLTMNIMKNLRQHIEQLEPLQCNGGCGMCICKGTNWD